MWDGSARNFNQEVVGAVGETVARETLPIPAYLRESPHPDPFSILVIL